MKWGFLNIPADSRANYFLLKKEKNLFPVSLLCSIPLRFCSVQLCSALLHSAPFLLGSALLRSAAFCPARLCSISSALLRTILHSCSCSKCSIFVYSGEFLWVDHCTFLGGLWYFSRDKFFSSELQFFCKFFYFKSTNFFCMKWGFLTNRLTLGQIIFFS